MFSDAVKRIQAERGSRTAYAKVEAHGGFNVDVTDELRDFVAMIDTAFLATADAEGQPYVQHRGGPKGFIRALDANTLAFADLAGNRQYISTGNLTENAKVCLFLIDYAHRQRVKVWGTARMVAATPELLERLAAPKGARAEQVCLITVTRWDVNCPKHIPIKLDAQDVAAAIEKLQARISELEAENAALQSR
ncbi:MAG TPA: pyridoxamine 5'-phosphate oxidase family protein [Kofleriaceae bacterium]|nr:pyridoxamine 5'-phosphate oxidase family protein [Kofleriaceae bacterium]